MWMGILKPKMPGKYFKNEKKRPAENQNNSKTEV